MKHNALLLLPALLLAACDEPAALAADGAIDPVAEKALITVDGRAITQADVDAAIEEAIGAPLSAVPEARRDALRTSVGKRVETRLVLEVVLLADAAARDIAASETAVDAELEKIRSALAEGETLADALARTGRDEAWLRESVRENLTIHALLTSVAEDAGVEDDGARETAVQTYVAALLERADIVRAEPPSPPVAEDADAPAVTWHLDYEAAQKEAAATNRPVFVHFTGSDWCPYCVKFQREVLTTAAFRTWAADNVILLEVDFPREELPAEQQAENEALRERHGVRGFPTVLFLDADGEELARTGYAPGGPEAWIAAAEAALGR